MTKTLKLIALCALLIASPIAMWAEELYDGPESEVSAVTITVVGKSVRVCGASGSVLDIFNVAGVRVGSYRIEGNDKTIDANLTTGCYILRVGNVVRKVSVK